MDLATAHDPRHHARLSAALAALLLLGAGCAPKVASLGTGAVSSAARPAAPAAVPSPPSGPASAAKTIYLTFDADMTAGMRSRLEKKKVSAWYDQTLIDELKKQDVPATVFSTGMFAEIYPDLIRDLARDGRFSIQNHTYDHAAFAAPCYGLATLTDDAQKRDEIERTQAILEKLTGVRPTLFRYPGLCGDDAHDDAIVSSLGLSVNDGNLVSGDPFSRYPDRIVKTVLDHAVDGSVVVMHLGGPNAPSTAAAVAKLIPLLREKGFRFAKL